MIGFQTNHSQINQEDDDEHHIQELISLSNAGGYNLSHDKQSSLKNKSSNF